MPSATQAARHKQVIARRSLELPASGLDVEIAYVANSQPARQVRFTMEAGRPFAPWLTVWPWFGWPAAVVLLYGAHRWLKVGVHG